MTRARARQDFAYFLRPDEGGRPGAFFLVGTLEERYSRLAALDGAGDGAEPGAAGALLARSNCMCHATNYDFNDNALPVAAVLFVRLCEARLGARLYDDDELPLDLRGPSPSECPVRRTTK